MEGPHITVEGHHPALDSGSLTSGHSLTQLLLRSLVSYLEKSSVRFRLVMELREPMTG